MSLTEATTLWRSGRVFPSRCALLKDPLHILSNIAQLVAFCSATALLVSLMVRKYLPTISEDRGWKDYRQQTPQNSHRHFPSPARRLGRIFSHVYFHHRDAFEQAEAESSLYARFLALTAKFDLVLVEFLVIPSSQFSGDDSREREKNMKIHDNSIFPNINKTTVYRPLLQRDRNSRIISSKKIFQTAGQLQPTEELAKAPLHLRGRFRTE